jgi:poly-gamma-glutamate capsule biosynthesis protein CapA/YwtB (metallophosphatase superfamily)
MPFVPVINFWSTRTSMPMAEVKAALQGSSNTYSTIVVPADDADALAAAAGVTLGTNVQLGSVDDIIAAVKAGGLGFLRVSDVGPSVRALGIDNGNLFGEKRITDVSQWPLSATVQASAAWDQGRDWTMVSVGDMMFDRLVRAAIEASGTRSYPFDGGTARVTGLKCCSFFGYHYPTVERTGNAGAVHDLISGADFTMGNLESAVLENAPYHADPAGFRFTTDSSWMTDLANQGFDALSTANNHSHDAGVKGLATAVDSITAAGMLALGSGRDGAALHPMYAEVNGVKIAIIACNAIANGKVSGSGVETLNCRNDPVASVVAEARQNADLVIVFPHWGIEYERPVAYQYQLAQQWIDAGADLIIGSHNHFPGGIWDYNGHIVLFSMGNFIFDQNFRQATLQGIAPEWTFNGTQLMQMWVHPLLIVNTQPNLADPATDGQFAFDLMKLASTGLDWGGDRPSFSWPPTK